MLATMLVIALTIMGGQSAGTVPQHTVNYCASASEAMVHGRPVIAYSLYVC